MGLIAAMFLPPQPGERANAKRFTREKILQAARRMFIEYGYEAATIREIANAAGMSTGAVFSNFADKSELFEEIFLLDLADVNREIEATETAGPVVEQLLSVLCVGYRYCLKQLPLFQACLANSWLQSKGAEKRTRAALKPVFQRLAAIVENAIQSGELRSTTPVELITTLAWESYIFGYRTAIYDSKSIEDLTTLLKNKLDLVVLGHRA